MTYGLFEAGPFGQKPIQISVRGAGGRRARPHLARADAGDGEDAGRRRHRDAASRRRSPSCSVRVDRERASDLGVPAGVIGTTLRAAVAGEVASVIEDATGDSHDVRVRLRADQRRYARGPAGADRAHRQGRREPATSCSCRCASWRTAEPGTGPSTIRRKDLRARGARLRQPRRPLRWARSAPTSRPPVARPRRCRPATTSVHRRRRRRAEGHVREHDAGAVPGRRLHLPDPGLAVRLVPAAARDHAVAAAVARGRRAGAARRPATRSTS